MRSWTSSACTSASSGVSCVAEVLEFQHPLDCRVALEGGDGGAHAQAWSCGSVQLTSWMVRARGFLGFGGALPVLEEGGRGSAAVTEGEGGGRGSERLAVFVGPADLAVGGDDAGIGPVGLVIAGAIGSGIHLEREFAGAGGQRDLHRRRGVGAAEGRRAEDFLAGDLHAELHGAAHAFRVEVVVNAGEGLELLRVRRQVEDDLAVGMGAQAVLELALPELDRRLHARLAEAQGVVVLAAEFDAHGGFVARRALAGKGDAGPVLHLLNLRRPGHDGVLRRIGGDVGGAQRRSAAGRRARGGTAKTRRREGCEWKSGTRT